MKTYHKPVRWMLTWFDKTTERLVGEIELDVRSEEDLKYRLRLEQSEVLVGEWEVDDALCQTIEVTSGLKLDLSRFDYFIGAVSA